MIFILGGFLLLSGDQLVAEPPGPASGRYLPEDFVRSRRRSCGEPGCKIAGFKKRTRLR